VLCAANDCSLLLVDVGIDGDVSHVGAGQQHIRVQHSKVAPGTRSFAAGAAMTAEQLLSAMAVGADAVASACSSSGRGVSSPGGTAAGDGAAAGSALASADAQHSPSPGDGAPAVALCLGELGIGNTTAAAALAAALTGAAPEQVCGRGTGAMTHD